MNRDFVETPFRLENISILGYALPNSYRQQGLTAAGKRMKYFPLKIVVLCLILTPILYIATLSFSQQSLEKHYLQIFQNIIIGDAAPLLNGTVNIETQIANNIQTYLSEDKFIHYTRLEMDVRVSTARGKIIYPTYTGTDFLATGIENNFDTEKIAKQNFEILNSSLEVTVRIDLGHGSTLANIFLIFYSGISFGVFFIFYRIGSRKAAQDRQAQKDLIKGLKKEEEVHQQILKELNQERRGLFENIKALNTKYQKDQKKAKINEDEMFNEIISLEEQLNTYIDLKKRRDSEIQELKTTLKTYEKTEDRRKSSKSRRNDYDFIAKRFTALYKKITMNRKALVGFLNLSEEQQIKAEEVIHQLDRDPGKIIIKRKVFSGKKHKTACLEVLFAYNGRLYFKKQGSRIEIVIIGTKNTQTKDMEYLHNL